MKLLASLALFFVLVLAETAQGASSLYDYDERLSKIARETLWQAADEGRAIRRGRVESVGVRCYRDQETFESVFEDRFGVRANRVIAYYAGGRDIHLRPSTCENVRLFFDGPNTVRTAGAYGVLLHEALHRQGLRDERLTTCFANEAVRWGTRFYGGSEAKALRARNRALTFTRVYAPSSYRTSKPNCLALTRRTEWVRYARLGSRP
ncbi:MAG: hypothetical protein H0U46_02020 [Actinobacteria bacterium]|nr:hypothetical protein [Actinomycetota bacterium]